MLVLLATVALRLPAFWSPRPLTVDDGVFGASAVAMRHGAMPFRDVFSSQGPLFLILVRLGDLVGFESRPAPRMVALVSALAVVSAGWWIARRAVPASRARLAANTAGLLLALSGSVLWTTGPIAADGPAVALATWAVAGALAYHRSAKRSSAVVVGVLAGCAFAIKSALVLPAVAVALVMVARTRRVVDLAIALGAAAAINVVLLVTFGPTRVWQQWFVYHLQTRGTWAPWHNVDKIARVLVTREWPLLVVGVVTVVWWAIPRNEYRRTPADGALLAWAALSAVLLILQPILWQPHVVYLVVPCSIVVGVHAPPARVTVAAFAVAAVPWAITLRAYFWPQPLESDAAARLRVYRSLPSTAVVIDQNPGLVWQAGRRTPSWLVDTSALRIDTPVLELRINSAVIAREAAPSDVCAVAVNTDTFRELSNLLAQMGYVRSSSAPLWYRPQCATRPS